MSDMTLLIHDSADRHAHVDDPARVLAGAERRGPTHRRCLTAEAYTI